jgi:hypothetical protein
MFVGFNLTKDSTTNNVIHGTFEKYVQKTNTLQYSLF